MTEKKIPFSQFMQTLRGCEVQLVGSSGIEFLTTDDGVQSIFAAVTPCLNTRNKNFAALFLNENDESLVLGSIYITEDCPAIFDKQNRSDFFDGIRYGLHKLSTRIRLVAFSSNGLSMHTVGERTQICIANSLMMEFEPEGQVTDSENQITVRYRGINYLVTSRHFAKVSHRNRALFAYQLVGGVYAKSKNEVQ